MCMRLTRAVGTCLYGGGHFYTWIFNMVVYKPVVGTCHTWLNHRLEVRVLQPGTWGQANRMDIHSLALHYKQ